MSNVQAQLPNYVDRLGQFKKTKERICSILLDYPHGLTRGNIEREFYMRYRTNPTIDNRLRELRKEGEVISCHVEGSSLQVWQLNPEKWKMKP